MSVFESGKTYALFASSANKKIINEINDAGAKIILFPPVETEEIVNAENENTLKNLADFDWIIFQTIYSVDYFLAALERLEIDFFELDALRICAFGETIADRLRYVQVHSDIISNTVKPEEVFQDLGDYETHLETLNFLIPTEVEKKSEIAGSLSKIGGSVTEIPLYKTKIVDSVNLPKLEALLKGGAIDEFIFCSPTDAANLAILFQTENFADLLSDTVVSAIDSTIFQSLGEFGITRIKMRSNL